MPASIALRPIEVSWLPSLGRMTSALTFLLISVSTAAICWAMSLVGLTPSNVTSLYWPAWSWAFLAIAAIQPWSAAGAEKPMVTAAPGVALSPPVAPTLAVLPAAGAVAGALLVQAVSAAPAPRPRAPVRNPRRPRADKPGRVSDMVVLSFVGGSTGGTRDRRAAHGSGSAPRRR